MRVGFLFSRFKGRSGKREQEPSPPSRTANTENHSLKDKGFRKGGSRRCAEQALHQASPGCLIIRLNRLAGWS